MQSLNTEDAVLVRGGDFWSGVGCGLGLVGALVAWTSPDPFTKIALLTYGGTALGCVTAYL